MQTDPTASAPRFLGKYEVLARLDSGGMAEIFLARSRALAGFEKLVVLKRILPHLAAEEEFVSLFLDEAKTTVALSHGNIVQVFDMGKDADGDYFIAMEYVAGKNLRRLTKRVLDRSAAPLTPAMAAYVVGEILKGLDYAHRRTDGTGRPLGIVHRDVSPHNILISYEGEVKVTDFGIAKAAGKVSRTEAGFVRGKANYMSPEQAGGEAVDGRSDLFGVGVLFWELLTGEPLYATENPDQTIQLLRTGPAPAPPSSRRPSVPRELDAIVGRALARRAEDRHPSADVFLREIATWLASTGHVVGPRDLAALVQECFAEEIATERRQIAELPRASAPPASPAERSAPVKTLDFEKSGEFPATTTGAKSHGRPARSRAPLFAAIAAAVLAGIPLAAWLVGAFDREPAPASTPAPTAVAVATPSPAAAVAVAASTATPRPSRTPSTTPALVAVATATPAPASSPVAAMARLSVQTNPWGFVSVDGVPLAVEGSLTAEVAGKKRTITPLVDYALKPGRHTVRVEQIDAAGRVVQRGEQVVELAPGERRTLAIPMQRVN